MHLSNLPPMTLLTWWAEAEPGDWYRFPTRMARTMGYACSEHQVRRTVKRYLRRFILLPEHRPPTIADYDKARRKFLDRRNNPQMQ